MELTFEDALRIARGCTDYGGGHCSNPEHYEIYQHGIQTVINALTAASKTGLEDMQTRALHTMGANPTAKRRVSVRLSARLGLVAGAQLFQNFFVYPLALRVTLR